MGTASAAKGSCLYCGAMLRHVFIDLGMSPLCESYLTSEQLDEMEPFYPLRVYVCEQCFLVQLHEYVSADEIFTEYAYFSSFSDTWVEHAKAYAGMMVPRFGMNKDSFVVELASNDGYLLQHFVAMGIPVLGVEPAANIAKVAESRHIPTLVEFFGNEVASRLAAEGKSADLIIGNNVLAQVPQINDFVGGIATLLKPGGIATLEFPHLMCLMEQNQFDTIYHEHFFYFSLTSVNHIFASHGLTLFDVDELPTHGGSLRIYARHNGDASRPISTRLNALLTREEAAGLTRLESYFRMAERVKATKWKILEVLIECKRKGKSIAGYGAPGKGNTLLNYCGIRSDFIEYTVDRNPYKQGKFLPGTHIPICHPDKIKETKPDYVLILPWNFKDEIMNQMAHIQEWGGQFIVPIPEVRVF
jgi:hypothetical protein